MAATPVRGRPRSEDRTEAILDAAHDALRELGFGNVRMQDVAERAGAGLATIYRRWDTREDLLAECIATRPAVEFDPTGDPRTDLAALTAALAIELSERAHLMASFLEAARAHDVVGAAVREKVAAQVRAAFAEPLRALLGADSPHVALLMDLVPGILMVRAGMLDEQVDPDALVAEVLGLVDALAATG